MRTLEKRLLVTRSPLECSNIMVRYLAGYTLHALSRRHGVSKARISYLVRRTLRRCGAPEWPPGVKNLREYRLFVLKEAMPWVRTLGRPESFIPNAV